MVDNAWSKMGVVSTTNSVRSNQYSINGKKVDREVAYRYVAAKLGRNYDYKKYNPNQDAKNAAEVLTDLIL